MKLNHITEHPRFDEFSPFIIESKWRHNISGECPVDLYEEMAELETPCPACGEYHPAIRGMCISFACPLEQSVRCARTAETRRASQRLREELKKKGKP